MTQKEREPSGTCPWGSGKGPGNQRTDGEGIRAGLEIYTVSLRQPALQAGWRSASPPPGASGFPIS